MPRPGRLTAASAALAVALIVLLGGCDHSNPSSPSPVCTYNLTPQEQAFTPPGGSSQFAIATDAACSWSVTGMQDWVTLQSPATGTGPATVHYTVLENGVEAAREVTLSVAGQAFRVRQEGRTPCAFTIAPETQSFNANGGSGAVTVAAGENCVWTATANDPWLTVSSGASGRGNGTVHFDVAANTATTSRTGTLTIAGRTFTVSESGKNEPLECTYSVAPVTFAPCMAHGNVLATLTTQNGCTWTAEPDASWLTVSTSQGTGSATVTIGYTDNYDAPRNGSVQLRWPTATAGQNVHVSQAGCSYGVSTKAISFLAAGGTGSFDVVQQSHPIECGGATQDRCVWTASASASWVTITSSMPRAGDSTVTFALAANTGATRTATIKVRDQIVTITQAAP